MITTSKGHWALWIMQLDFWNWYIIRNLWTHSLMWNMSFGMYGHANFALKWSKCRFCTQQCNAMKNCAMFMTFFPLFDFFCVWKTQIDCLFFDRCDNSCNFILSFCKPLWGLPQSVCSVWFSHLKILEWQQWSRLTFNESTKILILGFPPFF